MSEARGPRLTDARAWEMIDDQRSAVADLLDGLSEAAWERPSLCTGWTVRQVAAHVALQNTPWSAMPRAIVETIRHRGMNGAIQAVACAHAERPVDRIVAEIRERIGVHRPLPTVTVHETAIDYATHTLDLAVPLGMDAPVHPELAAYAADRVWHKPRMFHARRRFAGFRLSADDVGWAVGDGAEVTGPVAALLLLVTGRPAALERVAGPGADAVRTLLGSHDATLS